MAKTFINGFEIDVALTEEHAFTSEVTQHPVEKGFDAADHVRTKPIRVTLEAVVSDTPLGALKDRRDVFTAPQSEALARMLAIRDAGEPVTIITTLQTYENMVLEDLSVPRDAKTGQALRFRASFVQIKIVTNERTTVKVSTPRGSKKVNRGNKQSQDAPSLSSIKETNKSIEDNLTGRAGFKKGTLVRIRDSF